jgi:hypothetical protein
MQSAATLAAGSATGSVAGLSYDDFSVRVVAAPATLRWLEEFLTPSFAVDAAEPNALTVTLEEDEDRYAALVAEQAGARVVDLDGFINDSHVISLPAWHASADHVTAFQASFRAFYSVDRSAASVRVISRPGNAGARTALMRTVRELAMNRSVRRGGLFLHAAAVAADQQGALIAGQKHAGKTTLLLYLLRASGADYVANDRVLWPAANSTMVRGMPTIVTVRPQTVEFFPDVGAEIIARRYHHQRTLAEAADEIHPARRWQDGRLGISPAQLCNVLGVVPISACVPRVVLVPRITGENNAGRLHELTRAEGLARLRDARLSAGLSKRTSDLFVFGDDPPPPSAEAAEATLVAFAERVPCIECQLGTRSYADGRLAAECLRVLSA